MNNESELVLVSPNIEPGEKFISFIYNNLDEKIWGIYTCKINNGAGPLYSGSKIIVHNIFSEETWLDYDRPLMFAIDTCYKI